MGVTTTRQTHGGDPRGERSSYFSRCTARVSSWTARATPVIDSLWVAPRPPRHLLLRTNCAGLSKAQLLTLLGPEIESQLADVQLAPGAALLVFRDEAFSARARDSGVLGPYSPAYDSDGLQFQRILQTSLEERVCVASSTTQSRDSSPKPVSIALSCSRRVPCIVVFERGDARDIRRAFLNLLHDDDIHSVERAADCWHVHLHSTDAVRRVSDRPSRIVGIDGRVLRLEIDWRGRYTSTTSDFVHEKSKHVDAHHRQTHDRVHKPITTHQRSGSNPTLHLPSFLLENTGGPYSPMSTGVLTPTMVADAHGGVVDQTPSPLVSALPEFRRRLPRADLNSPVKEDTIRSSPASSSPIKRDRVPTSTEGQTTLRPARKMLPSPMERELGLPSPGKQRSNGPSSDDTPMDIGPATIPAAAPNLLRVNESGAARTEPLFRMSDDERVRVAYVPPIESVIAASWSAPAADAEPVEQSAKRRRRALLAHMAEGSASSGPSNFAELALGRTQSSLSARSRRLVLGRSGIHAWGLFAAEDIEAGALVIEYLGEVIRASLANVRERRMELAARDDDSVPILSSYLFRLDAEYVLDATHRGGLARFVNHSCEPSCVARTLSSDGALRIAMYARRDIRRGEEITYDYKFPLEHDASRRVRCLCGTRGCRGFLN